MTLSKLRGLLATAVIASLVAPQVTFALQVEAVIVDCEQATGTQNFSVAIDKNDPTGTITEGEDCALALKKLIQKAMTIKDVDVYVFENQTGSSIRRILYTLSRDR